MPALIKVTRLDGTEIGRCDAKCYNATHPHCTCVCNGHNHGVGLRRAAQQTIDHAKQFLLQWAQQHPAEKPDLVSTHKALHLLAEQRPLPLQ